MLPYIGNCSRGFNFRDLPEIAKKIDTAKNKPYDTSSFRVLEIATKRLSENLTALSFKEHFCQNIPTQKIPIYGISFEEYVSKRITHPVFYADLLYKLKRVKGKTNFISLGSKIVKRLRRRQYDPMIIKRTIGLVIGPVTSLYRSFIKRRTLANKAVGTM